MTGSSEYNNIAVSSVTTSANVITFVTQPSMSDDPEVESNRQVEDDEKDFNMTDTIAAVVSAILAVIFLVMVVCVIQLIKKRRRERQGSRLNRPVIQTVTPASFGASVSAYRNAPVTTAASFTWESVTTSEAPILHLEEQEMEHHMSDVLSYIPSTSSTILVTAILHQDPSCMYEEPHEALAGSSASNSLGTPRSTFASDQIVKMKTVPFNKVYYTNSTTENTLKESRLKDCQNTIQSQDSLPSPLDEKEIDFSISHESSYG